MLTLRLTQSTEGENQYRVEAALSGDRLPGGVAEARFSFSLAKQDQEDMRWYLEDFLQYPLDPAPIIAARIESRMKAIGKKLFNGVFQSNDNVRDLWSKLRKRLDQTRVEIVSEAQEATVVPWELMRDPETDVPIALQASAFVRAPHRGRQRHPKPIEADNHIRILLAICRPGGSDDVPFRSVASRLIKGLSEDAREVFQLEVLRPPTISQLTRVLLQAKTKGEPYHIVHFDGHGIYEDLDAKYSGKPPKNKRGYLLFENADYEGNLELVHGAVLGKTLAESEVSILVLNACRSAHAEPPVEPEESAGNYQPRGFGSLAQEVLDAGVSGVVAMRYNLYVVTAARFVANLYGSLSQGLSLGQAVTRGRQQLADNPLREIAYEPRPLQDWCVPVVYEAAPISFLSRASRDKGWFPPSREVAHTRQELDTNQPGSPSVGFFGRDETLLAIDRAFDRHSIVLLHAYAGSGKSATATEFAHWYALTGGVKGPLLFTSFEHYKPLSRVLDQVEVDFADQLRQAGVNWLALSNAERRLTTLKVLGQVPALWIWDNVEPIAGFPAGSESAWTAAEQKALIEFLDAAGQTKGKFLLTSRRAERKWLKNLPARVELPSMPFQERVQLARALVEQQGYRVTDVEDWRPLLQFTQGNPLTIHVLVGQALRERLKTRKQMLSFIERLRVGEADFEDETIMGRSKSLVASLGYGFERGFTEDERKQLALLFLFESFVNVNLLKWMTGPNAEWCAPELRGLDLHKWTSLLDRAAQVGLVEPRGGEYYSIHPALPWFLGRLFEAYYPEGGTAQSGIANPRLGATMAFVKTVAFWGNALHDEYGKGARDIKLLSAEEPNLLRANRLARTHGWRPEVIATMQGLDILFKHNGRSAQWARLVNEIAPDFIDPKTDGPLPGADELWGFVSRYRIALAEKSKQWLEAKRLLRLNADWSRKRASVALSTPPKKLDAEQRNNIRSLSADLNELGKIQVELELPEAVETLKESLAIFDRFGESTEAAVCALNLGSAYASITNIRDLAEAERWYRVSFDLCDERDQKTQVSVVANLASVNYERFKEAVEAGSPQAVLLQHINVARRFYELTLTLLPPDDIEGLRKVHLKLGDIYSVGSDTELALSHYLDSLRHAEALDDLYSAAIARSSIAITLKDADRLPDALEYAYAAVRNYEAFGDRTTDERRRLEGLIADIKRRM